MKTLDTISKYHRGVSITTNDGKTTIMVDGKSISPKSKQGKRILADTQEKMNKLDSVLDTIMTSAQKAFDKVSRVFDNKEE